MTPERAEISTFAPGEPHPGQPLTPRELEVLSLVAQGRLNKEIAQELGTAGQTVKNHLRSAFKKMDVGNRVEATRLFLAAQDEPEKLSPERQSAFERMLGTEE